MASISTHDSSAPRSGAQALLRAVVERLQRPAVALPLLGALLVMQLLPLWMPMPDGVGYLSIARSIAHGGPVTNLGSPKLHYPPGYPLLVSPLFLISDRPFLLLLIVQWLCCLAFMLGVYTWARRWCPAGALPITALAMANASLWMHARTTLSEPSFMALLVWTACAADRLAAASSAREAAWRGVIVAALMAALVFVKPVGILLAGGYCAVMLLRAWGSSTSWKRAAATVVLVPLPAVMVVAALVAYEAHTARLVGTSENATYLHEFKAADASLPVQLIEGVRVRVSEIGRLVVPGMLKSYARPHQWLNVNMAIYLPLAGLMAWAWWCIMRSARDNVLLMTFPFFVALYIAYPQDQGTRYLLPMLPVLAACAWWLVCRIPRHRSAWLGALIGAHLVVAVIYSLHGTAKLRRQNAQWEAADAMAASLHDAQPAVYAWRLPEGLREMVLLSADRDVCIHSTADQPPADAAKLLARVDAPDCPGFVEQARNGQMKLLVRDERLSRAVPSRAAPIER